MLTHSDWEVSAGWREVNVNKQLPNKMSYSGDVDDCDQIKSSQGLGKLASKFPNIAGTCINYLQDFLVSPSPILLKLYRQQSDLLTPHQGNLTVKGDSSNRPASASATAFEKLRDTAIENLCVALKAGLTVDANTVMAFISSISSREKAGCDRLPER
ncbi:Phosphatidylinositol 4-kinase alpha [Portunus trituberculatus]|uniref:Phosphatidylinositol 4-kinase alpha n=1 Tax=Portunus trituberculatus TaxID=210409 RepID=A0A5B7IMM9_PORTR|nr:Phosphatidylinositol 4-kinase alpha [Portunus trituberculatus]